ncbi:hypothetical protein [Chryseobacterium sp.]|jgi:hypothetical protein|uniref:hypothetical protein n=1 Tax=Chryseobacterium sp. TaxID=1871047 RepID=UPI002851BD37|nr:hypothetical protein [Chryseobacterium sp.]MDR3023076.1 hypothetical protein [Chryseobacterium sp.]
MKKIRRVKSILNKNFFGLSKEEVDYFLNGYLKVELDNEWYYLVCRGFYGKNVILYCEFNQEKVEEKRILTVNEKSALSRLFSNL